MAESARWWETRPAQSRQPKTYICPFCRRQLLAMNPNTLLFPEGDRERRRHAHTACVAQQRAAGTLLTRREWEKTQTTPPGPGIVTQPWWRRLFRL
jgi:hypothetical protein